MNLELIQKLIECSDYREFLKLVFDGLKEKNKNFSYSYFAKKAGFSSRSFPREVITGRKRITASSLNKFISGLNLTHELSTYFTLLVKLEEPDINEQNLSESDLEKQIKFIKSRLKLLLEPDEETLNDIFKISHWPKVYAALHDEKGSSISELSIRTGLNKSQVERELLSLQKTEMVACKDDKWTCTHSNYIFLDTKNKDQFFKNYLLDSLEKAEKIVRKNIENESTCFYNSTFSIDKKKLPELAIELRSLLHKYVDENEKPLGDCVANLTVAFWNDSDFKNLSN